MIFRVHFCRFIGYFIGRSSREKQTFCCLNSIHKTPIGRPVNAELETEFERAARTTGISFRQSLSFSHYLLVVYMEERTRRFLLSRWHCDRVISETYAKTARDNIVFFFFFFFFVITIETVRYRDGESGLYGKCRFVTPYVGKTYLLVLFF